MSTTLLLSCVIGYFILLIIIGFITSKESDNNSFYVGNRNSNWALVAYGMIGASLSGVTFISVPGAVGTDAWSYLQMVLGYVLGYIVIARILLPLYYKMNLTSIYTYLKNRFGFWSYKTGSVYFLISRIIGASFRLFLVAMVLDRFILSQYNIPFEATVAITIILIWIYSFKGGIKTIVWTDTLQTTFMLISAIAVIIFIATDLDWSTSDTLKQVMDSSYSRTFHWDWGSGKHFVKMFLSGMLITIVMTGLDQDMMQKNLSCKNIGDAQKNIYWMSSALVVVNILFLALGAMLYLYAEQKGIGGLNMNDAGALVDGCNLQLDGECYKKDQLFPFLSVSHFPAVVGVCFILGLMAAAYSSADSALTALTTSFCVDILPQDENEIPKRTRYLVHIGFSVALLLTIILFKNLNDDSIVNNLFKAAGFTYGPLLGMFFFGIISKKKPLDVLIPFICIAAPMLTFFIDKFLANNTIDLGLFVLDKFQLGFLILLLNGLLTWIGLYIASLLNSAKK